MIHRLFRTKNKAICMLLAIGLLIPAMPVVAVADGHTTISQGIAGYVTTGEAPGTPVVGATVRVWTTAAVSEVVETTTTVAEGFFEVELPAGSYYVEFEAEGYSRQYYDGVANVEAATEVTVGVGEIDFVELWGPDRYGTAIDVSQESHPAGADAVVIARGDRFPDALAGASIAGLYDAPILLTRTHSIPDEVADEIDRLNPSHIYILGETLAVSAAVEAELSLVVGGGNVTRFGGETRYHTAVDIAEHLIEELGDDYNGCAIVATGGRFPDALAASPIMAAQHIPLFLAHPTAGLADETLAAMEASVDEAVTIVGGPLAVMPEVEGDLEDILGDDNVERVEGTDRYETAVAVAEYAVEEFGHVWEGVGIATGQRFPDSLTGGPYQGLIGSVTLLTRTESLPAVTATALETHNHHICELVNIYGGPLAISQGVRNEIMSIITPCPAVVMINAVLVPVPVDEPAVLMLEKEADVEFFTAVGDEIVYTYTLTNIGDVALDAPFTIDDSVIGTISVDAVTELSVDATASVTATYTVTEADFATGVVTNSATARGFYGDTEIISAAVVVSVNLAVAPAPALTLAKVADVTTFSAVGDQIVYTYTLTNTGNVPLTGPFTVADNKFVSPIAVVGESLAVNGTAVVTATYTVTEADVLAGFVTNTATAQGFYGDTAVVSAAVTVTVCTTLADVLAADGRFTTLLAAAEIAGLDGALADPLFGPVTLFAPTDDAFAALQVELGEEAWDALLADSDALADVLLYHLLTGKVFSADVVAGITAADPDPFVVETLLGADVLFSLIDTSVFINDSEIIAFDIQACNGVIHVIDAVLVPVAPALQLEKVASTEETVTVGDEIVYTYTLTNIGSWALDGPFTVVDDKFMAPIAVDLGMWTELAVGASVEVTASYIVTIDDLLLGDGWVTNEAYAIGWFAGMEIMSATDTVSIPVEVEMDAIIVQHVFPHPHHHMTIDARGTLLTPPTEAPFAEADVCVQFLNTGAAPVTVDVVLDVDTTLEHQWWYWDGIEWRDAIDDGGFSLTLAPGVVEEVCFYAFFQNIPGEYGPFEATFNVYATGTTDPLLASTWFEVNLSAPGEGAE